MNSFKGVLGKAFEALKETVTETAKKAGEKSPELKTESEAKPEESIGSRVGDVINKLGDSVVKLRKLK